MNADPIEAIATWLERPGAKASQFFEERGFTVVPIKAGLLLQAPRASFESAFQLELGNALLPFKLPVPNDLQREIASISIPKPRQYQSP